MPALASPPRQIAVGDRVLACDESWLYSSPDYTLHVIGLDRCATTEGRGNTLIRVRVKPPSGDSFTVQQFAEHYEFASDELIQVRRAKQERNRSLWKTWPA